MRVDASMTEGFAQTLEYLAMRVRDHRISINEAVRLAQRNAEVLLMSFADEVNQALARMGSTHRVAWDDEVVNHVGGRHGGVHTVAAYRDGEAYGGWTAADDPAECLHTGILALQPSRGNLPDDGKGFERMAQSCGVAHRRAGQE